MSERYRESFFAARGIAQTAGRPWISQNLSALLARSQGVRQRLSYYDLISAIANAPTSWSAVPTAISPPTVTYGGSYETPDTTKLGGVAWKRYWFRGDNGQPENTGGGRTLLQRADFDSFLTQGPAFGGGVNYNNNSGNSTEWWQSYQGLLRAGQDEADLGNFSGWAWGFTLTGRGFAISGQSYTDAVVYVQEGGVLKRCPYQDRPNSDTYAYFDFGTSATRNILLVIPPVGWSSEIIIPTTSTMTPWSGWRAGKLNVSIMGDSYFQDVYATDGVTAGERFSVLMGGTPTPAVSAHGGSGYASDNGDSVNVRPFHFAHRLNRTAVNQPDIEGLYGGINDGWPTTSTSAGTVSTAAAIDKVLREKRRRNPTTLLVVGSPWAPNGPDGQNPAGKYQQINNYLKTALARDTGLNIFIDSLNGTWKTSLGDQRATAEGPWLTGTGNTGAPNGTGNADTYVGPDGTHLSNAGLRYIAEKNGQYMREAATAMLQRLASSATTLQGVTQTASAVAVNNIFGGAFDWSIFDPAIFEGSYGQTLDGVSQAATAQNGAGSRTATASQTLDSVTQSAAATTRGVATAAQTLAGVTQAAASGAPSTASAAQILAGVTQTATGVARSTATAAQTSAPVGQAATGTAPVAAVAAQPLAGVSQAAVLATGAAAAAAQTLQGVTQSATAQGVASAVAAQPLQNVTQAAAAATSAIPGASAVQALDAASQGATAAARVAAAAVQPLAGVAQSAVAAGVTRAAAAQALAGVAQAAPATAPSAASAAQPLANVGQAATVTTAALPGASATQVLAAVTQAATAAAAAKAAAAQQLQAVVASAVAATLAKAQAAQALASVDQVAASGQQRLAVAAQQLAALAQAAAVGRPLAALQAAQSLSCSQAAQLRVLSGFSASQTLSNVIQLAAVSHEYFFEPSERTYLVAAERRALLVSGEDRQWGGITPERRQHAIPAEDRNY